ncbi:MAG: MFS transporter [Methanothrix sp.]|uniref:MFS transporter n=1 Tax=Methanothrix sp. TaxID=90426 RepID=UPI0025D52CAE|nr:MFS transporter [Methanothrix sp.]MCQ8902822.1 MFS transporter [Methanothrix sp.]
MSEDQRAEAGSRNVLFIGLVSLLNDTSSEIIQPIMPLFITSLGGGAIAVGLVGGLSEGIPSMLKILSGYAGDITGKRKTLVVAGYGLSAVAKTLLPLSGTWQHVVLLKSVERCGKGVRAAPKDAIISGSVESSHMGRGFGTVRALDTFGAVLGSGLAYLLWSAGLSFRQILAVAAALSLMAFIPLIYVRDVRRSPMAIIRPGISSLPLRLRWFVLVASIFSLANFSYMFFMLRAQELFVGSLAVGAPLLLYILYNIVYSGMAIPSGVVSDLVGRRWTLAIGYALFSLVALGFAFVSSTGWLVLLFVMYGLVFAIVDGAQSAYVSDLSCDEVRCTALGVYHGMVGIASIASGLIAGSIWQAFGPDATFLFGALMAAAASFCMVLGEMMLRGRSEGVRA